jgi:predicted nucleic acid-binding protein
VNIICDTSIIVNFLKINRLDLLGCSSHTFWVSNHVHQEIKIDYPEEQQLFQSALEQLWIKKIVVKDPQELDLFIKLMKNRQLGAGECAAIAVAVCRGYFLAIDDGHAIKKAAVLMTLDRILRTQDIVVELIDENLLSDDQLLLNWPAYLCFKRPTITKLFPEDNLLQETSLQWGIFPLVLKSG